MVDPTHRNLITPFDLAPLSAAQRAFVERAEALGATVPATARALVELPRLSIAELDALVESGLVREASDSQYYVFRSRRAAPIRHAAGRAATGYRRGPWTARRYWRTFLFWLLVILIPILLLQLTARR